MDLPYSKVEAFQYKGRLFHNETAALLAAVEEVVGNPAIASTAVQHACQLSPLLARACELAPNKETPTTS